MYCPQCKGEYREGFDRCDDCGVDLVDELPSEDHSAEEYVKVFETSESDLIPVIKSLLEGAEIPYLTEGEDLMNLLPSEMLGGFYRPSAEVKFKVPAARAEEARGLFEASVDPSEDSEDSSVS
jgi:hypothetical protein